MLVLSDHIQFIYVLFFLSLFIFFIYFLDVITSKTVISRQKIAISEETPVRIFQNIWRDISAVSTVSFFLSVGNLRRYLTYFQDFVSFVLFHIFSFKLYPCHFLCQALFISRFMILDGSQWLFSFWDSFHLVLTFQSIKSKCIFLSLRSVILEGSWQLSFLRRCDERAVCSLNASLDIRLESDPCPNTEKYLEAHYVCQSLSEGPPTQGWSAEKLVKLHSDNLSSVMWCQSPSPPPPPPPPSYQHNNKYYTINIIICTSVGVKRELRNWYSNNWNGILQKQSWTALILNFNVRTKSY